MINTKVARVFKTTNATVLMHPYLNDKPRETAVPYNRYAFAPSGDVEFDKGVMTITYVKWLTEVDPGTGLTNKVLEGIKVQNVQVRKVYKLKETDSYVGFRVLGFDTCSNQSIALELGSYKKQQYRKHYNSSPEEVMDFADLVIATMDMKSEVEDMCSVA